MESFEIRVPDPDLEDLHRRLQQSRLTDPPVGESGESGVDFRYLRELLDHWRTDFDWRSRESLLNRFDQYTAEVDSNLIHFAHTRPDTENYAQTVPLILTHGWPYSFAEMLPPTAFLTDPAANGIEGGVAFEVVVPSLPGFGFSPPLVNDRFTADRVADLWHRLMTEVLGFRSYVTYGEDVGAGVSDWMAALHPESVAGLFATHAAFPPEERRQDLTDEETRFVESLDEKWRTGKGYAHVQGTRPDTLAVGLNDSPAGLLAWIVEKLQGWSGPEFGSTWTTDEILTTVSLYWFTQTIGTSFLPYYHGRHEPPLPRVTVPVGVSVQPGEAGFPRAYAERTYEDIRVWKELPRGGHFPAQQTPRLVAADIVGFVVGL